MTTVCLSIFERAEPLALSNHRYYCARMQYQHVVASCNGIPSVKHRILYKYERLLHQLRQMPEQALLICASEDCVFFEPARVEIFMQGRDYLLPSIDLEDGSQPQAIQVWRNTATNRALIVALIAQQKIGRSEALDCEEQLLQALEKLPAYAQIDGICCTLKCCVRSETGWKSLGRIWTLSIAEMNEYGGVHPGFRDAVFEHINDWQQKGLPLLALPSHAEAQTEALSIHNPGSSVAIVTLYTPNIRQFGEIAERNFKRYCQRHGYTLYVHHEIDHGYCGEGVNGNWVKPWLLHQHLPQHDWVFWVDADILFLRQEQKLEPFLQGRDIVAMHDMGSWLINAGLFGLKRTQANFDLLDKAMQSIRAVEDKSSVYVGGGDQAVLIRLLMELGWDLEAGRDFVGMNTPWFYEQLDSFAVHYFGMGTEYRSLMMARAERQSLLRAEAGNAC